MLFTIIAEFYLRYPHGFHKQVSSEEFRLIYITYKYAFIKNVIITFKQCCGSGSGRIRIVTEKTDPGSIKGSQNKGDKKM